MAPRSRAGEADADRSVPVVDAIRAAIADGEFVPNQRLIEADLSEQFGASRGSVRVALLQLSGEGLVERLPNRGARVRAISLAEAIEITEVRMALEGLCAAKAAQRITDEECRRLRAVGEAMREAVASHDWLGYSKLNLQLHQLIREFSGQATARTILERLRWQNVRHQFRVAMHPGQPTLSLPEHLEIIDALCARKPKAAEAAVRRHIRRIIDALPVVNNATGRPTGAR